jgi:hypothetical protein
VLSPELARQFEELAAAEARGLCKAALDERPRGGFCGAVAAKLRSTSRFDPNVPTRTMSIVDLGAEFHTLREVRDRHAPRLPRKGEVWQELYRRLCPQALSRDDIVCVLGPPDQVRTPYARGQYFVRHWPDQGSAAPPGDWDEILVYTFSSDNQVDLYFCSGSTIVGVGWWFPYK